MVDNYIQKLRIRLNQPLPGESSRDSMAPARVINYEPSGNHTKAGVLILLYPFAGELRTVFIKRTEYPGPHSGQISFPGGKAEKKDKSQIETALREACEETGISPDRVKVIGNLTPLYIPVSNIEVLPVVGYTDSMPDFRISKKEVRYLIEVPLKDLTGSNIITEKNLKIKGIAIRAPGYLVNNEFIWGATAMILAEFREILENAGLPPV